MLKSKIKGKSKKNNLIQPWSEYCPRCTLPSPKDCKALPCQTYNIKPYPVYKGIEISSCSPYLKLACKVALSATQINKDEPFGACVIQWDSERKKVLRYWTAHSQVHEINDATAHAEVQAIRKACHDLQRPHLPDCWLYSSCEPCNMCTGAVYYSKIPTVIFSATRYDAGAQGVPFAFEEILIDSAKPFRFRKLVCFRQASCKNSLDAFNYYKRTPQAQHRI